MILPNVDVASPDKIIDGGGDNWSPEFGDPTDPPRAMIGCLSPLILVRDSPSLFDLPFPSRSTCYSHIWVWEHDITFFGKFPVVGMQRHQRGEKAYGSPS